MSNDRSIPTSCLLAKNYTLSRKNSNFSSFGLKKGTQKVFKDALFFHGVEHTRKPFLKFISDPSPPEEVTVVAVSDAKIKCSWTKPSGNGDQISGYAVGVNANAAPSTLLTVFEVEMDNDAGEYSGKLKLDEANICSVSAVLVQKWKILAMPLDNPKKICINNIEVHNCILRNCIHHISPIMTHATNVGPPFSNKRRQFFSQQNIPCHVDR